MSTIATCMITALKSIAIVFDVIMFVVLLYFASGLRWRNEKDRSSIIGFGWMLTTVGISVMAILIS